MIFSASKIALLGPGVVTCPNWTLAFHVLRGRHLFSEVSAVAILCSCAPLGPL